MSVYGQDGEKWAVVPHLAGHLAGCSDEARPEQADPRTCDLFIFSKQKSDCKNIIHVLKKKERKSNNIEIYKEENKRLEGPPA